MRAAKALANVTLTELLDLIRSVWHMKSLALRLLSFVTPRSWLGIVLASAGWLSLVFAWHFLLDRYLIGSRHHTIVELAVEAVTVAGPFVFLFVTGGWFQLKAFSALKRRAYYDPLSGVLNRQTFLNHVRKAMTVAPAGLLLLIDADHFKRINDTYGHAVGDRCISAIGHRLQWHTSEDGLAGRLGGEEFGVFLPNVTEQHGCHVATRLGQPVEFTDDDGEIRASVTMSMGAAWMSPEKSLESLFRSADDALYLAKSSGRAQIRFADNDLTIALSSGGVTGPGKAVSALTRSTSKLGSMLGVG